MPVTVTSNTVTVRPASNVTSQLTISASNANPLVDFNGSYRVIVDGRPGGTGTTRNLVFDQQSTTVSTVRFQNDAIENTIRYCVVRGGNATAPAATVGLSCGIIQFGTTTGLLGNNNNTVSNCLIREATATGFNPTCGVFSVGNSTAGRGNLANNILNNEIANIFNASVTPTVFIYVSSSNSDWNISGNSLYLTPTVPGGGASPRVYSATSTALGIMVSNTAGNGFTVNNNFIGGSQAQCGGSPWTIGSVAQTATTPANTANIFAACSLSVGTSSNTVFQGNKISNFAFASTTTLTWSGLLMSSGNLNCLNNTFGGATTPTSSDTIAVASSGSTVTMFGVQHTGGTTVVYSNNIF
ncbi:MAG: hypothetical protein JNJ85_12570, partial [Candidatus Kapabacteria bacterium]|nr:hypothetical protein [Candidatus Kapabacteria bacterium]